VTMRIIAGNLRGRKLKAPKGLATRPVLARVREALFNALGSLEGLRILDLFSGTGAIGLEGLSRGAQSAVFVDSGAEQCAVIRSNLDSLGMKGEVIRTDVNHALDKFARTEKTFDFVFADPPYEQGMGSMTVNRVCTDGILSPEGIMAVTVRKTEELPEKSGACMKIFDRKYGDTRLAMYHFNRVAPQEEQ
jgi:16S rRNA (guanine966-N2)-methyltransferase